MGGMQRANQPRVVAFAFSSPTQETVISTEAAHAFVNSAAGKSASLPSPSRSPDRAVAVASASAVASFRCHPERSVSAVILNAVFLLSS
jgi:hypothetical protein